MTTSPPRKRDPLALKASEVRIGMDVIYKGAVWSVWSQAPGSANFWLTRWVEKDGQQVNQTANAAVTELERYTKRAAGLGR